MAERTTSQEITFHQHLVYVCSKVLAYALPLFFFLVANSFYLKTYDSAQIKITFTQIGGTMLAFVWLTKILIEGRWPFTKKDLIYVAPFIAFLCSGLISYIHTPFKGWALEETLRRVVYMFLALITIAELKSTERMARLWRWLMAAAWLAVGYGVLQYIDSRFYTLPSPGIDPFIWRQAFGARVFSTFGNPNFYGNFLVIITPLIFASILREKGPLFRPFILLITTLITIFLIDKMTLRLFGGFDPSFRIVFGAGISFCLFLYVWLGRWRVESWGVTSYLMLFGFLALNIYATETKGAWLGFVAAISATFFLIMEYFLKMEEISVNKNYYSIFMAVLGLSFAGILSLMVKAFVLPLFSGQPLQTGFSILWIPVALAGIVVLITLIWVIRSPWNLKKVVYGILVFIVIGIGGLVLHYAKGRLFSVSFRQFTWIATWEMIRTNPLVGNGVGTFKVIYPAFRRPDIIVLEGKSNTETDHSEDEYLEVWQDEGIVGFSIFVWMFLTAIFCGLKQLKWHSQIRAPDLGKKRSLLVRQSDPRSYEVLGYLGAYIGALFHWCVDVSIRFVSSGVFSGLLPGVLVAYARNHATIIREEVRLPYDRFIRLGVAGFWTAIFIWLRVELIPQSMNMDGDTTDGEIWLFALISGFLLFGIMELLENGLKPQKEVPFQDQYLPINPVLKPLRWVGIFGIFVLSLFGIREFSNHFQADVHHNLAIFFSKQAIWAKEPKFDSRLMTQPPDIRKKYNQFGGALEHYAAVVKNNPNFPMAYYFTGNVYNDRGSEEIMQANQLKNQGNAAEAERHFKKAFELWDLGEKAYEATKKLAPNYVQTHHQMGLLYVKRAEGAMLGGNPAQAEKYYDEAYKNFRLYNMIDPVFVPNTDRMVQILLRRGNFEEAKRLYKQCIYHNDVTSRRIRRITFPDRLASLYVSLAKVCFTEANQKSKDPFHPLLPETKEAVEWMKKAADLDLEGLKPENGGRLTNIDAWKGYGFFLEKMGRAQEAQDAFRRALQINPNDPELRMKR